MLDKVAENIFICNLNNEELLKEVTVKIGLERINMQEEVTVEVLLDSGAMGLVISLELTRKQRFVMGCLNTNNFIFLFFSFSDFILILFSHFFYFSFG